MSEGEEYAYTAFSRGDVPEADKIGALVGAMPGIVLGVLNQEGVETARVAVVIQFADDVSAAAFAPDDMEAGVVLLAEALQQGRDLLASMREGRFREEGTNGQG